MGSHCNAARKPRILREFTTTQGGDIPPIAAPFRGAGLRRTPMEQTMKIHPAVIWDIERRERERREREIEESRRLPLYLPVQPPAPQVPGNQRPIGHKSW